jgi:hypothetical protein
MTVKPAQTATLSAPVERPGTAPPTPAAKPSSRSELGVEVKEVRIRHVDEAGHAGDAGAAAGPLEEQE